MTEKVVWFVSSYVQRNLALIIVILAVLLVRLLMKKMPKKLVYCLWAIVGVRMLLSIQISSPVSIYQFFPWADPQAQLYASGSQMGGETASTMDGKTGSGALAGDVLASDTKGPAGAEDSLGLAGAENLGAEELLRAERTGEEGKSQGLTSGDGGLQNAWQGNAWKDALQSKTQDDTKSWQEWQVEGENARELEGILAGQGESGLANAANEGADNTKVSGFAGDGLAAEGNPDLAGTGAKAAGIRQDATGAMTADNEPATADGKNNANNFAADADPSTGDGRNTASTLADGADLATVSVMPAVMAKLQAFLRQNAIPFFGVWFAGMLVVIGIGLISYVRIQKLVRQAVHFEGNIWECDGIMTPFVLGIIRPRIFVPFHLKEEHRELVLEHERQHVKHFDPFMRLLAYALLAVYWMNPLVWVSYFCFVRDQEMRCDEAVLSSLGAESKKQYGLTLLAFATEQRFVGFTPVAFGESDAEKRIKNVLDYKKPSFWAILAAVLILLCLAIVCLTTAMKNKNAKEPDGGTAQESAEGKTGTEEKQGAENTKQETIIYQANVFADLDGDGEKEQVEITDYTSGKTVLKTSIQGKVLEEHTLKSVEMIRTEAEAADLDGDGCEELILLKSSPMFASTFNWPGEVTILQVKDGAWDQLSDRFIYPEHGEAAYQEYFPRKITDSICIGVRIESTESGMVLRLIYPQNMEVAHGMDGVLRMDCTYQAEGEEGWLVQYVYTGHDYLKNAYAISGNAYTFTIKVGDEPSETSEVSSDEIQALLEQVPYGEFQQDSGRITNPRKISDLAYLLQVEGGSHDGDRVLLYLPGYPIAEIPYKVIQSLQDQGNSAWEQYHLEELPCYVLQNLNTGMILTSAFLDDYIGQRMETVGLYGELSYPAGANGEFSLESATQLCADAAGMFVQKVKYPQTKGTSFSSFVRNDQLVEYLEYKTKHYPYEFSDGPWLLEIFQTEEVTIRGEKVLNVMALPKCRNDSSDDFQGILRLLIAIEDGRQYIRDWYWDALNGLDSRDFSLRGEYDLEEAYDYWDHPADYKTSQALKVGSKNAASIAAMGLQVTYLETWNNPDPELQTNYRRIYVSDDDVLVAESHGFGENQDYVDDLDGDGVSELICYAKSMETGDYDEVTVFRRKNNLIYMGRLVNAGLLNLENCDTLSASRRISEHYDPENHQLYLTYPVKGGDYANITYTYEDMLFTEFSYVEPTDWKEKYADRIRRMDADQFALIYLDDDEIPEVYCANGANGMAILTCHDGKVQHRILYRDGLVYLEKQGIYYTEGGNMGYFPMEIVQLKDGEFSVLAQGLWTSEYVADENNPDQMKLVDTYQWEGTNVSAEEYYKNIDEIIERKNATKISGTVSKDEILTELGMVITSLAQG